MTKIFNYIIGDIHGCFDEFLRLEEKIHIHASEKEVTPFIISVGDIIDRGNDSYSLLKYFMEGKKNGTHDSVIGNHEVMMLQAFECYKPEYFNQSFPDAFDTYKTMYDSNKGYLKNLSWESFKITMKSIWVGQGGYETLKSFDFDPENIRTWDIDSAVMSFLLNLSLFYEGENFIVTHGLSEHEALKRVKTLLNKKLDEHEKKDLRLFSNSLIWNRTVPEDKIYSKIHVSGHTPLNRIKRLKKANAIQIDTGCVFGNKLTAYCPETNECLYIKSATSYSSYS